jgi:hypothetical protein
MDPALASPELAAAEFAGAELAAPELAGPEPGASERAAAELAGRADDAGGPVRSAAGLARGGEGDPAPNGPFFLPSA